MKLTDLLDQIERLDQAATKGPWEIDPSEGHAWAIGNGEGGLYVNGTDKDTEFIALARTALPQLAKALRAVLEVHQKTEHQRAYGFPKADKWEHYCTEDNQSWPCPTVQAIADSIGDDDERQQ